MHSYIHSNGIMQSGSAMPWQGIGLTLVYPYRSR